MLRTLGRSLKLREGEGPLLAALGAFLFLTVTGETLLSATRNTLFLAQFDSDRIAEVMVAAAIVSAAAALGFTGVMGRFGRRTLALGLMTVLASTLLASYLAYERNPRSAYGIYLWVQAVEVLALTHAWDYMGDLLTGRQAKRLLPLAGAGASVAAVLGGLSVGPLAGLLTSQALLLVGGGCLVASIAFLWMVPEPEKAISGEEVEDRGALADFVEQAGRGFRGLANHALLRLLAVATLLLVAMNTLIDLQWKVAVDRFFDAGAETAMAFGLMQAAIGLGALFLQVLASRVVFPKLGISGANLLQAGSVALLAIGYLAVGGFILIALLRFLDEALGEAIEKPAQQITLIPFPPRTKNATFTTLDGVVRPIASAGAAFAAFLLLREGDATPLPWMTVGLGVAALVVLSGHRKRYMKTLEEALSRHLVDLRALGAGRLTVDRGVLTVVDRFLEDDDPTVVVFALSLLRDLPPPETAERASGLLEHPVPEVRMEAARALGNLADQAPEGVRPLLVQRLGEEPDPDVLGSLLVAIGSVTEDGESDLGPFLEHPEPAVRRAALTALAQRHPDVVREHLQRLLDKGGSSDREAALSVVGILGYENFLPAVTDAVLDDDVRPAAVNALAAFGVTAIPGLERLIHRRDLDLPVRRTLVTTLAAIDDPEAHQMLIKLVGDDELGPAALTSLRRLRSANELQPLEPGEVRHLLRGETERGARYALLGAGLETTDRAADYLFVVREMEELRIRHLHRTLALLTLSYEADGIAKAESAIFSDDEQQKSNALEYLESRLVGEDASLVIPVAEWERGEATDPLMPLTIDAHRALERPLDVLAEDTRWWPRALARYALSFETGDDFMIPLIEKVMLLKGSDLFRGFPGDELAGIAELAKEEHFDAGEVIFEQGDPGDAYYLVVRGAVSIVRDGHELAVLGSREGFGEMAILDQETRSATARAAEATTLLSIDRDSFDQLVERNPAIARGIYRVLTQRLRSTLARIAAGH